MTTTDAGTPRLLPRLAESLGQAVARARPRADEVGRAVLASASTVLDDDPGDIDLLGWTHNSAEWASFSAPEVGLLAAGSAVHVGEDVELPRVAVAWRSLMADAVRDELTEHTRGPVVVFGRAYCDRFDETGPWHPFGWSRAVVPSVSLRHYNGVVVATASTLVAPEAGNAGDCAHSSSPPGVARCGARKDSESTADLFRDAVAEAVSRICRGQAEKVVLARAIQLDRQPPDPFSVLRRLDASFPQTCRYAFTQGGATFLGATPERLCSVRGRLVRTMALAGSVPPGGDDFRALADPKLREEHAIVSERIQQALRPRARSMRVDRQPRMLDLANVRHLRTNIEATLATRSSVFDVVQWLHPTPAVGGHPTLAARALIDELEGIDRGWYAGPVGWADATGDGDCWVALRCALLAPERIWLYAGAGIVRDSDPDTELQETDWKLAAMRDALGIESLQHWP